LQPCGGIPSRSAVGVAPIVSLDLLSGLVNPADKSRPGTGTPTRATGTHHLATNARAQSVSNLESLERVRPRPQVHADRATEGRAIRESSTADRLIRQPPAREQQAALEVEGCGRGLTFPA
jgi:hypothetical protein